jgi:enoyl-CoA hydratase/carnithine racemase
MFPLLKKLRELFVETRFDRSVRCVVVTGAGRGFCSGMDMSGNPETDRDLASDDGHVDTEVYRLMFRHEAETFIALRRLADLGRFWSLPKVLGWRKAMELMMTGRFMSAEEAHASGFTLPREPRRTGGSYDETCARIRGGAPIAQKLGKSLAWRTSNLDFDSAMQWSESTIPVDGLSHDSEEGMRAFMEKRDTDFLGR